MKRLLLLSALLIIGAESISAQEVLDERAKKHYSAEQIAQMSAPKIAKVNFYFNRSFEVYNTDKCPTCPEPNQKDIDISIYENHRQLSNRSSVMESKGQYRVVLLSVDELNVEYKRIEQEYNSKN